MIKASEIKEFLLKITNHKTPLNKSILEKTEQKLSEYLADCFKPMNLDENFQAANENHVANNSSVDDYNLKISKSQEQEIRKEMQNTINMFGKDW